jgi:hypothetical protein
MDNQSAQDVVLAHLRRQGFDESDRYSIEHLVRLELPRAADETSFLIAQQAREHRTGALIGMIIGVVCVIAPLVHRLVAGPGNLSHWVLPVLGLALIAISLWLRLFGDPERQAQPLLSRGLFVVGRVAGVMGGTSQDLKQHITIAYELPSGQTFGLGVQGRGLGSGIEEGDHVLVLCCPDDLKTAGMLTPSRLLTIGNAYPTAR